LWKYGARAANPRSTGTLQFADIGTLPGDQCAPRIGDFEHLAGKRPRCAPDREDRQFANVQRWWAVFACIGNADIQCPCQIDPNA